MSPIAFSSIFLLLFTHPTSQTLWNKWFGISSFRIPTYFFSVPHAQKARKARRKKGKRTAKEGGKKEKEKEGEKKEGEKKGERKAIAWTVRVSIFFFFASPRGHFSAHGGIILPMGVVNQPPHNMAVRTAPLSHTEKQKWS